MPIRPLLPPSAPPCAARSRNLPFGKQGIVFDYLQCCKHLPCLYTTSTLLAHREGSETHHLLRVQAPGAPHLVTGLASWYMGSGFLGGEFIQLVHGELVQSHVCQSSEDTIPEKGNISMIFLWQPDGARRTITSPQWLGAFLRMATSTLASIHLLQNKKACIYPHTLIPCCYLLELQFPLVLHYEICQRSLYPIGIHRQIKLLHNRKYTEFRVNMNSWS